MFFTHCPQIFWEILGSTWPFKFFMFQVWKAKWLKMKPSQRGDSRAASSLLQPKQLSHLLGDFQTPFLARKNGASKWAARVAERVYQWGNKNPRKSLNRDLNSGWGIALNCSTQYLIDCPDVLVETHIFDFILSCKGAGTFLEALRRIVLAQGPGQAIAEQGS